MVVKMMKWPPWPPGSASKRYHVNLVIESLKGLSIDDDSSNSNDVVDECAADNNRRLGIEIRWKGGNGKSSRLGSPFWKKVIKRNFTESRCISDAGAWEWNEEFHNVCVFMASKEGKDPLSFQPWDVCFSVIDQLTQDTRSKPFVLGKATLNLSEYISSGEADKKNMTIPVSCCCGAMAPEAALSIAINFVEMQNGPDAVDSTNAIVASASPGVILQEKEELSAIKASLRKVKIIKDYVAVGRAKKACREEDGGDGRFSARSEECDYGEYLDEDSADECDNEDSAENNGFNMRNSFSYGTLAEVNCVERVIFTEPLARDIEGNWNSNHVKALETNIAVAEEPSVSEPAHAAAQSSMRHLLLWRKRKFRSPRARGEPLLNKSYGEEGGDDIDYDRRQLCSSDDNTLWNKAENGLSEPESACFDFGDDHFAVGKWERREFTSRDGHLKLSTEVFFASIDQRSEKAAGESACTTLVAVIADWLHDNQDSMPVKSQFDDLIREGSLEWRNLCQVEEYRERFPDKHFDLDTVLRARGRTHPLLVEAEKSFVGFFQPEEMEDSFEFLQGVMSFDAIWEEITKNDTGDSEHFKPRVFIVSWNDHFFVLKIEKEAYYIIDTLGERLFEGCNQAYVLKFDDETTLHQLPEQIVDDENSKIVPQPLSIESTDGALVEVSTCAEACALVEVSACTEAPNDTGTQNNEGKEECTEISETNEIDANKQKLFRKGKETCKDFIKGFWAALPLRELQTDMKKGLIGRNALHNRLQIEFHFTVHCSSNTMDTGA